jgi:hypothetical protein
MKYFLYKFSQDIFDGMALLTAEQKDLALVKIKREYRNGGTVSYKSEEWDCSHLSELLACIQIQTVSKTELDVLQKFLPDNQIGELGPLSKFIDEIFDNEVESEPEYCSECGEELEDYESEMCESCSEEAEEDEYEEEYNNQANKIHTFIKKEYGIESSTTSEEHSRFLWKPTPKSELEIIIPNFDEENNELEISLKINGKEMGCDFFSVEDIYDNPKSYLNPKVKEFIEKAKSYQ